MFNRIADKQPAAWKQRDDGRTEDHRSLQLGSIHDWISSAERLVSEHPGAALMAAFLTGATIAWWLKRK